MSRETSAWLNQNTLIGFTDKRGTAWHYRAADQGDVPASTYPQATPIEAEAGKLVASNHYKGAVPTHDVNSRLFSWDAVPATMGVEVSDILGVPDRKVWRPVPKRQVIVRSDTLDVLGVFKDSYVGHPYGQWLIETTNRITSTGLDIASAGLLKNGAQAWVSYEVPDTITTPEGVAFRPQLLATTSFDGSIATTYKRVTTLTVCDNTLAAALGEAGQMIKVRHSRYSHMRMMDARDALNIVHADADAFAAEVKALAEIEVTDKQWSQFLDEYVPLTKDGKPLPKGRGLTMAEHKREDLSQLWNSDLRAAPWKGTAWGVVQAANTWFHHKQTVRGALRQERNMDNVINGRTEAHDNDVLSTLNKILQPA